MKKLVVVLGSARRESVSEKAAMRFIEGAQEAGYEAVIFRANDMKLGGCRGCGACRRNDTDCVVSDDMQDYLKQLHSCDALLITSPNYYAQVAGPMITFMNRHYCLTRSDKTQRLENKVKLAAIFAQGAPEAYEKYPPVYDWYISTFQSKGMELCHRQTIGGDSDINAALEKAYAAGRAF